MSHGACRALAATLLALIATVGVALPGAAEQQNLDETSIVEYTVNPNNGQVNVDIVITLAPRGNRAVRAGVWGPIVVEEGAKVRIPRVVQRERSEDLPGRWEALYVRYPQIAPGERLAMRFQYQLDASVQDRRSDVPARVDRGYIYVCIPGQDTDQGSTSFEITRAAQRFQLEQSGTTLELDERGGLESNLVQEPRELFTCVESANNDELSETEFFGPDDRRVILQAWPGLDEWLGTAERTTEPVLDGIRDFLDLPIPGNGPVIIRQAPPREIGGYASDHDTPGIVQLDETGGVRDPEHELAHAWFGTDNIQELWLREGLVEWTASSMRGEVCAPVDTNGADVTLEDWKVVEPFADPRSIEADIEAQNAAACGIVSAMAARMSDEQWREVLGSMLRGETKYNSSGGPGQASTTTVNYQEFLDAVDERGLIPAGDTDLDFAQNLVQEFGAEVDIGLLAARSDARARYHQFLNDAAPLAAPMAVREAMDDWEFQRANEVLDKSYDVLAALNEASELLPAGAFTAVVQPLFEAARSESELDDVLSQTQSLRDSASEVFEPLGALQTATARLGWTLPAAISEAITEQRFDDIMSAIPPSAQVVEEIAAANEALPQAGVLETFQTRYEVTASIGGMEELAESAAEVRAQADRTAVALSELQSSVGDWQIPAAVTAPLDNGQIDAGFTIINDARAVIAAARAADLALPEAEISSGIRTRFEAVTNASEMAALRADAQQLSDQAQSIGGALAALEALAPDWQLPPVIETPAREQDFATAAEAATIAETWIREIAEAHETLPQMDALELAQADFESAETLEDLELGAARAEASNRVAGTVAGAEVAVDSYEENGDLIQAIGLWGVDLDTPLDRARLAAIEGDQDVAFTQAAAVINAINDASSAGGLRLAGIVFLGVAILGVAGLWLMLRREAGPPWARQTKPHWVEDKKDRRLLGRGKKKPPKPPNVQKAQKPR